MENVVIWGSTPEPPLFPALAQSKHWCRLSPNSCLAICHANAGVQPDGGSWSHCYPYLYMLRSWLVEVHYKNPCLIRKMKKPKEVLERLESNGALLALSSAVVRTKFCGEDKVRYLFDHHISP